MIVLRHTPKITYHKACGSTETLHTIRCAAGTISERTIEDLAHSTLYHSRRWRKQWPGVADALVSVAAMLLKRGLP